MWSEIRKRASKLEALRNLENTGVSQTEGRQGLLIQEPNFILVAGKEKKIIGNILLG